PEHDRRDRTGPGRELPFGARGDRELRRGPRGRRRPADPAPRRPRARLGRAGHPARRRPERLPHPVLPAPAARAADRLPRHLRAQRRHPLPRRGRRGALLRHHRRHRPVEPRRLQPPRAPGRGQRAVPRPLPGLPHAPLPAGRRGAPPHRLRHRRGARGGRHPRLRRRVDPRLLRGAAAPARGPPRRAALPRDLSGPPPAPSLGWTSCPAPDPFRRIMSPAPVKLAVGDAAPALDLPTAGGGRITLEDLRGAPALLWFYPAANTSLCTKQACDLRDNHQMFLDAGYRVIGISPDPVPELDRFVAEQDLPYTLASDESHVVMTAYGAWGEKNMYGKIVEGTIRSTFAIDEAGVLTFVKYRVGTPKHIALLQEKLGL